MNDKRKIVVYFSFIGVLLAIIGLSTNARDKKMIDKVYTTSDILSLFHLTPAQIDKKVERVIQAAGQQIEAIIAIEAKDRTYENTARALDHVCSLSDYAILSNIIGALEMLSPDENIRNVAHQNILKLQEFSVDAITNNKQLYEAFKSYCMQNALREQLTPAQHYYLSTTLQDFERSGLALPEEQLHKLAQLKKDIMALSVLFERNIAQDNATVLLNCGQLAGVSEDMLAHWQQAEDNCYHVSLDYPSVDAVLQNCTVENSRKKVLIAFNNRAYPANDEVLKKLLKARKEFAQLLGYENFAHYDLADQMVESPATAHHFLQELLIKALPKVQKEFALLCQYQNAQAPLAQLKAWDVAFLKERYKNEHYKLDQNEIATYFPLEKTIDGLLSIYALFLGLTFKQVTSDGLAWHPDVLMVQVFNEQQQFLGTLLLDLHPRANKYSHACHATMVPSVQLEDKVLPGVSIVVANFPKSTAQKPALLKLNDVNTFFHEFGHALHSLLGSTPIASLSGTNTKRDFVELPSQILEEWLWDKDILKMLSSHYQTGEPLPDSLIDTIIELKKFDAGFFIQRQVYLSLLALEYYQSDDLDNLQAIMQKLYQQYIPYIEWEPENHMYASFGHLPGYGAKYYGYLWSRVFAHDLFSLIKQEGLLNPAAGKRYIGAVLSKGGSQDPNQLLEDFLGRKPNNQAFLENMGLL